jgi:hypothetical protein
MLTVFSAGDVALLDQSIRARTEIDKSAYYIVKSGNGGVVRRVKSGAGMIYLITEDSLHRPMGWQRVHLQGRSITHLVRARAYLVNPVCEWL